MSKLFFQISMSLDGYVADREGRFEWGAPDEEVHAFVNDCSRPVGTFLLGRRMYDVLVAWETFELAGQRFQALNGGPQYRFSPATSFYVDCDTQEEIDTLWSTILASGGKPTACGWIDDGFGLTWQIVPRVLPKLLMDPDPQRAGRAMQAMMGMVKLDIAALERAYRG